MKYLLHLTLPRRFMKIIISETSINRRIYETRQIFKSIALNKKKNSSQ